MLHMTEAPATVPVDEQHNLMATSLTPALLLTPWRKSAALLHALRNRLTSWTRRRAFESRWIRPDQPPWETPTDLLARKYTYLYIRSMSG